MSRVSNLHSEPDNLADKVVRRTTTTGTTVEFDPALHANRVFVLDTILTVSTLNFKLPQAVGSGDKYTFVNNAAQTFGFIVSCGVATDYLTGVAIAFSQTVAEAGDLFLTTATSDKMTFNATTTGGLGGDYVELVDYRPGYYLVRAHTSGAGTLATPFSAT